MKSTNYNFTSNEEKLIFYYLEELKDDNFIKKIIYQPESFNLFNGLEKKQFIKKQLKTKIKKKYYKNNFLINKRIYTANFKVIWNDKKKDILKLIQDISNNEIDRNIPFFFQKIKTNNKIEYISFLEVKGNYDKNGDQRSFLSRTQPWIWEKYNIYIQMIKPIILFKNTFIPKKIIEVMYYKKKYKNKNIGDKKYDFKYKTKNEFLNN